MRKIILTLIIASSTVLYFGCNSSQSKSKEVAQENHDGNNHETTDHDGHSHEITKTATTANFVVYGNCGMCKTRIEETAMNVEGVTKSEWNKETKVLELTFAENTNVENIQKAIAEAGHDNGEFKADDDVYAALPSCCHYRENAKTH